MTTSSMMAPSDLSESLDLVEIKPGLRFSKAVLKYILPDVKHVLFFGKVYELDYVQLSALMATVLDSDLVQELTSGVHSTELQTYLVDELDLPTSVYKGAVNFSPKIPTGEILPEIWKDLEVTVAQSIKDVAEKLTSVIGLMPGKQGNMVFASMMKLNVKRPTLGVHKPAVHHAPVKDNLVVLDVSGSMTAETIRKIVDDVVALSYAANAHMAIVSNTVTHWEPGSYDSDDVLAAAEFGGTQYEMLKPLFDWDWGVVVSIADYDSSYSAKTVLAKCQGRIDQVIDVSLVNQPTFLAECIGQLAGSVKPVLIAQSRHVLSS